MKTSRYPRKYLLISKPPMEIVISNIEKWTYVASLPKKFENFVVHDFADLVQFPTKISFPPRPKFEFKI